MIKKFNKAFNRFVFFTHYENFYTNNKLWWVINDNGNLSTPDNRDIYCHTVDADTLICNTFTNNSDDRLKHNEVDISGLEIIRQLKPQKYQNTSEKYPIDYTGDISCEWIWGTGLIAQDILKINDISYCVGHNSLKDTYSLNYNNIFVYGLQATKELDIQLQEEKAKTATLQTQLQEEKVKITALQTQLSNLLARVQALENNSL